MDAFPNVEAETNRTVSWDRRKERRRREMERSVPRAAKLVAEVLIVGGGMSIHCSDSQFTLHTMMYL
jgi:hypothetical protein